MPRATLLLLTLGALLLLGCTSTAPTVGVNGSASVSASVGVLGATATTTPTPTALVVANSASATVAVQAGVSSVQNVTFTTKDGWALKGTLFFGNASRAPPVAILVHGLGEDRYAFGHFTEKLVAMGWSVLIFDSRGHGESVMHNGVTVTWKTMSQSDFQTMPNDVAAAQSFVEKNVPYSSLFLVGASIGANAVFIHAAKANNIAGIVLLSPGLEYQGLNLVNDVPTFSRPFYVAAALGDDYGLRSSLAIYQSTPASTLKGFVRTEGPSHGTGMLNAVLPDGTRVDGVLIEWMKSLA